MTRIHPVTGAILVRGVRPLTLRFGDQTRVIEMPGWYADDDLTGEYGLHDPDDMRVSDRLVSDLVGGFSMAKRHARLETLIDEAIREPTPTELQAALLIDPWQICEDPLGFTVLIGKASLPSGLTGAEIRTSPLLRLEMHQGWARTLQAYYRLGEYVSDRTGLSDAEIQRAIDRNRQLIPSRPSRFEPPGSSRV